MTARSAEREEFLASIVTTAVEGGTGYWATVSEYEWDGLPDREVFAVLHETYEPGEDDDTEVIESNGSVQARLLGLPPETYRAQGMKLDITAVAKAVGKITRGEVIVGEFGSEFNRPLGDYAVKTIKEASDENEGGMIDSDLADIIAQVALLGIVRYG
jgi:hypothetical protein